MADVKEEGSVVIKTKLDTSGIDRSIEHIKSSLNSLSGQFEAQSSRIIASTERIKKSLNGTSAKIAGTTSEVGKKVKAQAKETADVVAKSIKNVTADGLKEAPGRAKQLTDQMAQKVMPVIPKEYNPIPLQYRLAAKGIIKAGTALSEYIRKGREARRVSDEFTHILERGETQAVGYAGAIKMSAESMNRMINPAGDEGEGILPKGNKFKIEGAGEVKLLSGINEAAERLRNTFVKLGQVVATPFAKLAKLIKPLTKSLLKLGKTIAMPFATMANGIKGLVSRFRESGLLNFFGELGQDVEGIAFLLGGSGFLSKFTDFGSTLTEVQNVVDVTFEDLSDSINEFAKNAAKAFGLSETMAKKFAGTLGAMAKSFGFTTSQATDMAENLTALAGDVASFYNISQEEAFNKLKSVFTGDTHAIKSLGIAMTQAALEEYALSKGITKSVKKMTEQEKVALRYNYVLEKLSGATGDFSRTSQTWANQTRLLKLQFESIMASIGQGLINIFNPLLIAINKCLEGIAKLAEAFRKFTVQIRGGDIEETTSGQGAAARAAGEAMDYLADETDEDTEATKENEKEKQKYLSGLDEIARWSDKNKDDDEEDGMMDITPFESNLDEAEEAVEMYDSIPAKINALLKKVYDAFREWQPKIVKALETLGKKFNDFITKIDWDQLGRTIGAGMDLFASAVNAIVDTVDWENLGRSLSKAMNGLLDEVDWFEFGRMLGAKFKIITDLLYGFVTELDWDAVGRAFAGAISGIISRMDFVKIADTVVAMLNGVGDAIMSFINTFPWGTLADGFAAGINRIFDPDQGVNWADLGKSFERLANKVIEELTRAIDGIEWGNIGWGIAEFFNGMQDEYDPEVMAGLLNSSIQAFFDLVQEFSNTLDWDKLAETSVESIKAFFTKADPEGWARTAADFLNNVFYTFKRIGEGMPWRLIGNSIGRLIKGFFEKADFASWASALAIWMKGIMTAMNGAGETIPWTEVGKAIATSVSTFFEKADFAEWGEAFNTWLKGLLRALVAATDPENLDYQAIGDSIGEFLSKIDWIEALSELGTVLSNVIGGVLEGLFNGAEDSPEKRFSKAFIAAVGGLGIANKIAGMFGQGSALDTAFTFLAGHPILTASGAIIGVATALGAFDDIDVDWGGIKDAVGGAMDRIKTSFTETVDGDAVKLAGENIARGIGSMASAALAVAPGIFDTVSDFIQLMIVVSGGAIDMAAGIINGIADAIDKLADSALIQGLQELNDALNKFFSDTGPSSEEARIYMDGYNESIGQLAEFGNEEAFGRVRDAILALSASNLYDPTVLNNLLFDLDNASQKGQKFSDWSGTIADTLGNAGVPLEEFCSLVGITAAELAEVSQNADTTSDRFEKTATAADAITQLLSSLEQSTQISDYEKLTALIGALDDTSESTGDTDGKLSGLAEQMRTVQQNDGNFSGYLDNVSEKLKEAGVKSEDFKAALIKAIQDTGNEVPKELEAISTDIEGFAPEAEKSGKKVGEAVPKGMTDGTESGRKDVEKASAETAKAAGDSLNKELEVRQGSSGKTKDTGKAVDTGLSDGMKEKEHVVRDSAKETGEAGIDGVKSELNSESAEREGGAFMEALASSIRSKGEVIRQAMEDALSPAENVLDNFGTKIGGAFEAVNVPLNNFITRLNNLLYGVQNIQNEIARLLSFNIDLPVEVAQIVGYNGFQMDVPRLTTTYQIPLLARGAVIPPNSPFLAVLGDQKQGTNVEAPLSTIEKAVTDAMAKKGTIQHLTVTLDRKVLFDAIIQAGRDALIQTGRNSFEMG